MWLLQRVIPNDLLIWLAHPLQNANNFTYCAIGLATVLGGGIFSRLIRYVLVKRDLAQKRKEKLSKCQNALKQLESDVLGTLSSSEREKIIKLDLSQLIIKLQAEEITPSQVLSAYQSKAIEVNKQLNCLVEPITEASEQAKAVEQLPEKGPLYGVPISLKDNYSLKGYDCTLGCARFVNLPYSKDAVIVQVLKKQGAIPFVKTNVPQTMISWETTNPMFGMTRNPYDTTRGVGGSSGGETALIAGGGSILGFGSDVGGSIRIPANMCGVYGLKPTDMRISNKGMAPILKGQTCVCSSYGPLGKDVDSLVIAMKAMCVPEMSLLDPTIPYKPFNMEVFESKRKLKIGFYLQDGFFHAVPAMERAVLEAKQILESRGHEVMEWNYPNIGLKGMLTFIISLSGDGGEELFELVRGDAVDSSLKNTIRLLSIPKFVRKFLGFVLNFIYPGIGAVVTATGNLTTISEWWKFVKAAQEFKESVTNDWIDKGLDAVICPGFACPALPLNTALLATGSVSYTSLYNVLNYPTGSLPVTKVISEDNEKMKNYPVKDLWHRAVKKFMRGSEGLPVNVQVAALPWQEELVLRIMKEIQTDLKK